MLLGDVAQAQLAALLVGLAFTSLTDKNLLQVLLLAGLLAGVLTNQPALLKARNARRTATAGTLEDQPIQGPPLAGLLRRQT
jgi:hypothetical protein